MTWWIDAAQYITDAFALVLVIRLVLARDRAESVFIAFSVFLAAHLTSGLFYFVFRVAGFNLDYRFGWLITTALIWIASLVLVYSLAKAVLDSLPAILKFSTILLNIVFPISVLIGMITVRAEYWAAAGGTNYPSALARTVVIFYVLDRAISMASLLVLMVILGFILWFPVRMPKNVAIFSIGFVIYFSSQTALGLLRTYSSPGNMHFQTVQFVNLCASSILILCSIYWLIFLDPKRQTMQVRMGHGWSPMEQEKLIGRLDAMEAALARSTQRL